MKHGPSREGTVVTQRCIWSCKATAGRHAHARARSTDEHASIEVSASSHLTSERIMDASFGISFVKCTRRSQHSFRA